jgi:preprotein translocase subunit SecD
MLRVGRRSVIFLAAWSLLVACARAQAVRKPGVRSLAFVLEVQLERAREVGWGAAESDEARVLRTAAGLVRRRLQAMDRSFRLELKEGRIELSMPSIDRRDRELLPRMLRSMGVLEFLFVAEEESSAGRGIDLEAERERLRAWRESNPERALAEFNALEPGEGGPGKGLQWCEPDQSLSQKDSDTLLLLPRRLEDQIGAASLRRVYSTEAFGEPAIGVDFEDARIIDLKRVTAAHVGHCMAIVLGDRLLSTPHLNSKLTGSVVFQRFSTQADAARWLEPLRELDGPLRVVEIR